jgi:hypothetical protein
MKNVTMFFKQKLQCLINQFQRLVFISDEYSESLTFYVSSACPEENFPKSESVFEENSKIHKGNE